MTTWLIDARTLALRPTGVGMYAKRHVVRLMREEPDARFVLACDVKESAELRELESLGAEIHVYGKRVFRSTGVIGYFRFLKRVIAEVKPDVFWQPNNLQPFKVKGAKRVIVTMHDVFGLTEWSLRYMPWHVYYRFFFWRTLRNATEIWFNSKETEGLVRAQAPQAMARLKSRVAYPLIEVPRREDITRFAHPRPFFLYVGNIEGRKGADLLFDAYVRYRAQEGRADLLVAGLRRNVSVPKMEGLSVLGYVDDKTKFSLMCTAVAMIVPSRAEGYGMQVAEAAALGVRCLASDLSVFREIDATGRETFPIGDVEALVRLMRRDA